MSVCLPISIVSREFILCSFKNYAHHKAGRYYEKKNMRYVSDNTKRKALHWHLHYLLVGAYYLVAYGNNCIQGKFCAADGGCKISDIGFAH